MTEWNWWIYCFCSCCCSFFAAPKCEHGDRVASLKGRFYSAWKYLQVKTFLISVIYLEMFCQFPFEIFKRLIWIVEDKGADVVQMFLCAAFKRLSNTKVLTVAMNPSRYVYGGILAQCCCNITNLHQGAVKTKIYSLLTPTYLFI